MRHELLALVTLAAVWTWAVAHQIFFYYLFAVGVDQLPAPKNSYGFYAWMFGVLQVVAANINRGTRGVQGKLSTEKPPAQTP